MSSIDATFLKTELVKYLDVDKIKELVGMVGVEGWNPFELDDTGKIVGFDKAVTGNMLAVAEISRTAGWLIEKIAKDTGAVLISKEKRDALVEIINRVIDIPFVPESIEGWIIGKGVDAAIAWLNKFKGADWLKKVAAPTLVKAA